MQPDLNSFPRTIETIVDSADPTLLLALLRHAQISVGHLRGRLITVPGYQGHITFSQFNARIEDLYQQGLKPLQEKKKQYEKDCCFDAKVLPLRDRGWFMNLLALPITVPAQIIGDAIRWAITPYPEISEENEKIVASAIRWRKETNVEFDRLINSSQTEIEQLARKSYLWSTFKQWDSFLNTKRVCQNTSSEDATLLARMVESRLRERIKYEG